jgi:predicted nucleic acid-binding Zn ribbon protein
MTLETPALPEAEPTHGCVRCGALIPIGESMCEDCNPLGLKAPAASQAHGIAFLGIGVAVVLMAVVARFAIAGVGPFYSAVTNVAAAGSALRVTVALTNQGSAAGSTTCRIDDPAERGIGPEAQFFESPQVQPGKTLLFDVVVTSLGAQVRPLAASCS